MSGWDWSLDGWIVLTGVLSACSCALLGNYLVLRRLSLMGDAISHAVLPGLAVAFLLTGSRTGWPMFLGAVIVGVLTALLTRVITEHGKVEHGAAMGVVFSILFAAGLVLIRQAADKVDLDPGCVLYGNIVNVALDALLDTVPPVVINLAAVLGANILFVALFYKELKITAFDPDLATTLGIGAQRMHYALMVMVAVTTVANFEAVGSILVIAMLIVPAAAAHLMSDRLGVMILVSMVFAVLCAVLGHGFATFGPAWVGLEKWANKSDLTVNTAAMMAVVAGAIMMGAIIMSPQYGIAARMYHRLALSLQIVRQDILGLLYRWGEFQNVRTAAMHRREILKAVGDTPMARLALLVLRRRGAIVAADSDKTAAYGLTAAGLSEASNLIGSHRLWEAYLARHFQLPQDHLHEPAERMEHYITPEMRERLRQVLADPAIDPQGKPIPPSDQPVLDSDSRR